ncbi:MAG: hypothetical protein HZA53_02205 [Planctomycetes bacterium]|nr:hypothetical protein [Planctomycetota bacterium]
MSGRLLLPGAVLLVAALAGCRASSDSAAAAALPANKSDAAPAERGLVLHAEPGWQVETPSSSMRRAQYLLPRAEGDAQDAALVVYHFGTSGGSKEANIERWKSQFEGAGGSVELTQSNRRNANGLDVLDVAASGTYVAETAPGSGVRVNEPGWRMLASIVDTPEGPYYVKLVGPGRTVEKWSASYRAFVSKLAFVE